MYNNVLFIFFDKYFHNNTYHNSLSCYLNSLYKQ